MDADKIIVVSAQYLEMLKKKGYSPERMREDLGEYCPETKYSWLSHIAYMAQTIPELVGRDDGKKIHRCYGCVQMSLMMSGNIILEDAKRSNMPPDEEYNRDA